MAQGDPSEHSAPGWEAIDAALATLYPGQEPKHFGTLIGWRLGGPDPLDGISAWKRLEPVPHWHFVSYGLSELYDKQWDDPQHSGFGFELTFRLACDPAETDPPLWACSLLQNIARYVFESGNKLGDGEWMNANGPIAHDSGTLLGSLAFVADPELPAIDTPHGRVMFIQAVGLTLDEEGAVKRWHTRKLLETLLPHMPLWVTDIARHSLLDRPDVLQRVADGGARDGSSTGWLFLPALRWSAQQRFARPKLIVIELGAGGVEELLLLLSLRLPFGRELRAIGSASTVIFAPGESFALAEQDGALHIALGRGSIKALQATLRSETGRYKVPGLDGLVWDVQQTVIGDHFGMVVQTIG